MFQQIIQHLNSVLPFNEQELTTIKSCLEFNKFKAKELILKEGYISKNVYFINKGCIRYFYLNNGEEKTVQFFFENAWYTDYESFLTQSPSKQYIQAIEKTETLSFSKSKLEELYIEVPKLERFGRIMAERAYLGARHRGVSLTIKNPEEHYLELIRNRPKVIERIPQHYIASYLGIQAPSLSRIRRRLLKRNTI